jgi:bifunctional UDP-N-acetylglucosamine pyrophosphorylase/glucosamine-1-phosphate N-acetyltransferase
MVRAMSEVVAVVLAAGKGTRMASDLPKVLHRIGDDPLVAFPIRAARAAGAGQVVVVVGYGAERVRTELRARFSEGAHEGWLRFAEQAEQLGTGHAVLCALPSVAADAELALVLSGDVPYVRAETLRELAAAAKGGGLALCTFRPPDPTGYGRILRDADDRVVGIREQRDASEAERAVGECNAGTYAIAIDRLRTDLPRLGRDNAQGEIYLTDLVALAAREGPRAAGREGPVAAVEVDPIEAAGVNTPEQLAELARLRP